MFVSQPMNAATRNWTQPKPKVVTCMHKNLITYDQMTFSHKCGFGGHTHTHTLIRPIQSHQTQPNFQFFSLYLSLVLLLIWNKEHEIWKSNREGRLLPTLRPPSRCKRGNRSKIVRILYLLLLVL